MVLDSGSPPYRQLTPHPDVFGTSLQPRRGGKTGGSPPYNGLLCPFLPPSPSVDLDSSSPGPRARSPSKRKGLRRPGTRPPSDLCPAFQSPCNWMRRSESICGVNRSSRDRGQIRSATSLPHLSKAKEEGETRNRTKSPCLLVALRPVNVEEEKARFFQSAYTYNPQFEYGEPVPETVLEKYKEASGQFIAQAVGIINAVLEKYGTYESFEASNGGKLLSKCQIWSIIRKYMQKEGCSGEMLRFAREAELEAAHWLLNAHLEICLQFIQAAPSVCAGMPHRKAVTSARHEDCTPVMALFSSLTAAWTGRDLQPKARES